MDWSLIASLVTAAGTVALAIYTRQALLNQDRRHSEEMGALRQALSDARQRWEDEGSVLVLA